MGHCSIITSLFWLYVLLLLRLTIIRMFEVCFFLLPEISVQYLLGKAVIAQDRRDIAPRQDVSVEVIYTLMSRLEAVVLAYKRSLPCPFRFFPGCHRFHL